MENVLIVGGFGALFSEQVRKLISGQFIDTSNKGDVAEVGKTLRAISKDNTGDMTVESVELEQGLWKRRTLLKFGASEARKAGAPLEETQREQIETASCRERMYKLVSSRRVEVPLKKKQTRQRADEQK